MHKWDPRILKVLGVPHGTVFTFVLISSARILDADAVPRILRELLHQIRSSGRTSRRGRKWTPSFRRAERILSRVED